MQSEQERIEQNSVELDTLTGLYSGRVFFGKVEEAKVHVVEGSWISYGIVS